MNNNTIADNSFVRNVRITQYDDYTRVLVAEILHADSFCDRVVLGAHAGIFMFDTYSSAMLPTDEYHMAHSTTTSDKPLRKWNENLVCIEPMQMLESIGEDEACEYIREVLGTRGRKYTSWSDAWAHTFRLLNTSLAVQMAVENPRLAQHLSPAAASLYEKLYPELAESGTFL